MARIDGVGFPAPPSVRSPSADRAQQSGDAFGTVLERATEGIQLSRHAQKRVDRRDLALDAAQLGRLDSAISRAAEKGARNSIVMLDDLAVVVDVRQRTVVTAMQQEGGRVFTNIDSVVIA